MAFHANIICCILLPLFFYLHNLSVGVVATTVPAMYVFGDSLADVGNNNHLHLSILKANFPHNGVDFPGRRATGRFSNGKNAADFLAEKIGLQTPPPYLSLNSLTSNKLDVYATGVNFASGGAGIMDTTAKALEQCIPLNKQIDYFAAVSSELEQQMGSADSQKHLYRSLFIVVIGSNDLFGYFRSSSRRTTTPQQHVASLVETLGGQLKRLYGLGARKLAFVGTGAIGCTPSQRNQNRTGDCNVEVNYISNLYNQAVATLLSQMKSEYPDIAYSFFDTHKAHLDYIQKPSAYGLVEVRSACCGLGSLNAKVACIPIAVYCRNRNEYMFWDFYHPTEAFSRMLVDQVFDGSQAYASPINVRELVSL